jgi:oxazoline/thiazoline dehydrogenase
VLTALCRLGDGPVGLGQLPKLARAADPDAGLGRLRAELVRLVAGSALRLSCVVGGEELLRATADGPLARFDFSPPSPTATIRLSRFAYAHRVGDTMVLESPASYASVEILAPALGALIAELAQARLIEKVVTGVPGCAPVAARAAVGLLLGVGALTYVSESGQTAEESLPSLAQREFIDVAMHAASRRGLTCRPTGGTYRFRNLIAPAPAIRPLPAGARVDLPKPDLGEITTQDPPLAQVMESRRSVREHGTEPISISQVGEFLFRVARVKQVVGINESAGRLCESSFRTSPSGGSMHDLEVYVTVGSCRELHPGIYHYDPAEHRLTLVCERPELVRRMLLECRAASGCKTNPQVLITLASRFARLSWKYQGIAYALTLKNVGVLYEAMYLAATAMGLAPCGLGCGDSALFSAATGLDPMVESSVGEFMLGTRAKR